MIRPSLRTPPSLLLSHLPDEDEGALRLHRALHEGFGNLEHWIGAFDDTAHVACRLRHVLDLEIDGCAGTLVTAHCTRGGLAEHRCGDGW